MKKRRLIAAVTLSAALAGGAYLVHLRLHARSAPLLPEFTEPGPGPRAPAHALLGAQVGEARLDTLQAWLQTRGLACRDTSARALMAAARAKKAAEGVDAVSSASARRKSPMERNPQVRLSCEGADAAALDRRDRGRRGRALFVFDSEALPLRHASFRRMHRGAAAALQDAQATLQALEALYGPPTAVSRALPASPEALTQWTPYDLRWRFADLEVQLTLIDYGAKGTNVYEAVQVPLPVRPDAPAQSQRRTDLAYAR
jgi:hypothetical protein